MKSKKMKNKICSAIAFSAICSVVLTGTAFLSGTADAAAPPPSAGKPLSWRPLDEPGCGGWMVGMRISPHDPNRMLVSGDMLGVGLSTDGGKTWQPTFGFKSYEMADITWHPTDPMTVWVAGVMGPYVSHDGGRNWTEKRVGMPPPLGLGHSAPIEKVLFDSKDATHLIALGGSSRRWDMIAWDKAALGVVWESHNSGDTWTKLTTLKATGADAAPDTTGGVNIVSGGFGAGSSQILYAGLDGHGVWVSENGGKTWTDRTAGLPHGNVERVIPHPADPNTVFVSLDNHQKPDKSLESGGVYKSTDGGRHWLGLNTGLRQNTGTDGNFVSRYKAFAICEADPSVMYVCDWAYDTGLSYVTTDGGAHWRPAVTKNNFGGKDDPAAQSVFHLDNSQPAGLAMTVFSVDPKNPNVAYGLSSDSIIGTRDGGKTWTDSLSTQLPGGGWRGRGYTGWCSMNVRFNPYKKGQSSFQAMDAARIWVSDDDLHSWHRELNNPNPWGGGLDTTWTPDGHVYATTGVYNFNGIGRSTDGGRTWQVLEAKADANAPEVKAAAGLPDLYAGSASEGIYARPDVPNQVWAVLGGKVYASKDGGNTWNVVFESRGLHWLAGDPKNPARVYVSGDKNLYVTEDGATWKALGGPHQGGRLAVDGLGRVYVAARTGDHGGLWRYDPKASAGQEWTRLSTDANIMGLAVDPTNSARLAYTTNTDPYKDYSDASGVWVSADSGKSWAQANDGLAMLRGHTIAFNPFTPSQVVFGSFGRGFFVTQWPEGYAPKGAQSYATTDDDRRFASVQKPDEPAPLSLRNGDMTAGTTLPDGWDQKWVGHGTIAASRDTTIFHSAPASLLSSTAGADAEGNVFQFIDATPGTTFTLSGYIKTQGVTAQVAVQPFTGGWSAFGWLQAAYTGPNTDWTAFSKTITVPPTTARFALVLWVKGSGKAWLDDVKVTDIHYPQGQP